MDSNTPLHVAARFNCVSVAKLLVSSGANVKQLNDDEQTPLQLAKRAQSQDVIRLLNN